jgi:DNA-binding beta-propeller fold protein YncE
MKKQKITIIIRLAIIIVVFLLTNSNLALAATETIFASVGTGPSQVIFDSVGNIYTANSGNSGKTISKVTPSGTSTVFATLPASPSALAIDSADNIYAVNGNSNLVMKINPSGIITTFATLPLGPNPMDLIFDDKGNLYVASWITGGSY